MTKCIKLQDTYGVLVYCWDLKVCWKDRWQGCHLIWFLEENDKHIKKIRLQLDLVTHVTDLINGRYNAVLQSMKERFFFLYKSSPLQHGKWNSFTDPTLFQKKYTTYHFSVLVVTFQVSLGWRRGHMFLTASHHHADWYFDLSSS